MSLSVILPNYNHGALIARALHALGKEVPPGSEIIVVDDGSTDNSVAVIESLQRRYDTIRLVRHDVNRGITPSVDTGLKSATGEFLLLAASDDFILPGLLTHAIPALRQFPQAAFFCSEVAMLDEHCNVIGFRPFAVPRTTAGYVSPEQVRRAIRRTDFWFIGTSMVFRRKLLAEIGYFDETLGSLCDVLAYRLLAFRHGFYFEPDVLAAYTKYAGSYSGRIALSVADTQRLLATAAKWIAHNLPEDVRDEHGPLFDRRMRFGMARLWVVWRKDKIDTDAIGDVLNLGRFDRNVIRLLSHVPRLSSYCVLGWLTIRKPPFSIAHSLRAWWRNLTVNHDRRARVEALVAQANKPVVI